MADGHSKRRGHNQAADNACCFDGEQFSMVVLLLILIFLGFFGKTTFETPELPFP
ncbi:hypothetical protein [Aneurinibacillus sp. REN35]|uniref:hypothetical protein n=1 Tax=Aneurinibacillus sp. REN35 TaxID=3237286 RepID=UPI003526D2C5